MASHVYERAARHGGIAAVPLNEHRPGLQRDPDGTPLCAKGLRMTPLFCYDHPYGYRARRFRCPLLFPTPTGQDCDHEQFAKGKGCQKDPNWELGGLQCVLLGEVGSQRGTVVSLDLPQVAVMVFWRYHRTALFQLPLPDIRKPTSWLSLL